MSSLIQAASLPVSKAFLIFSACIVKFFKVKNAEFKARSFSLPAYKFSVAYEEYVSSPLHRLPKGLLHPLSEHWQAQRWLPSQRCTLPFYLDRLLKDFDPIVGVSLQAVKSSKVNCYNVSKMYCFRDKLVVFLWVIPKAQIINIQMICQDRNQIKLFILPLRSLNWK